MVLVGPDGSGPPGLDENSEGRFVMFVVSAALAVYGAVAAAAAAVREAPRYARWYHRVQHI